MLKSIRDGFGEGLIEAGEKNKDIVVLTADWENQRVWRGSGKNSRRDSLRLELPSNPWLQLPPEWLLQGKFLLPQAMRYFSRKDF